MGKERRRRQKGGGRGGKAYADLVLGPYLPWPCINRGGGDVR